MIIVVVDSDVVVVVVVHCANIRQTVCKDVGVMVANASFLSNIG